MADKFFWYDVMTTDPEAAGRFYAEVIGWDLQTMPSPPRDDGLPSSPYTVLMVDGVGVAGLMPIPEEAKGMPPCWMSYIHVKDLEASVASLQKAGGTLHRGPVTVEGVIRFAVVSDPQGAGYLLATPIPQQPIPELAPRRQGTVGWHELYTDGWQKALEFYSGQYGWTKAEAFDMGPMGTYQLVIQDGSEPSIGMMDRPSQIPMPFWQVYFHVDAIGAAAERVKAAGGRVLMGPHQVPGGDWIVQCMDPQGAAFALTSRNA